MKLEQYKEQQKIKDKTQSPGPQTGYNKIKTHCDKERNIKLYS